MTSKTTNDCEISNTTNYTNHWNLTYAKSATEKLGWFEKESTPTLQLLAATNISKNAKIVNVGVGSSTLINDLIDLKYTQIIANDLSSKALDSLKERLQEKASKVDFIVDDLTQPTKLNALTEVAVWNDRAVLHFFLSDGEKATYLKLLKKVLKKDGYVIIAAFSLEGAKKCCGLNVQGYDSETLVRFLGDDFELQQTFNHTFVNPNGDDRPYVYTLFKRVKK